MKPVHLMNLLLLISLSVLLPARGASARAAVSTASTLQWNGSVSAGWGDAQNWTVLIPPGDPSRIPASGDVLVFPAGAAHLVMNNNLPGLHLSGLAFDASGYSLAGQEITLEGPLTLGAGLSAAGIEILLALVLGSSPQVIDIPLTDDLNLCGVIKGTSDLLKRGGGDLVLCGSAPNSYTGKITVEAGSLVLTKSASQAAVTGLVDLLEGTSPAAPNQLVALASEQFGAAGAVNLARNTLFSLRGTTQSLWKITGEYGTIALDQPGDPEGMLTLNPHESENNSFNYGGLTGHGRVIVHSAGYGAQGFGYNKAQAAGLFSGSLEVSGKADLNLPDFHSAGPIIVNSGEASLYYASQVAAVTINSGTLEINPGEPNGDWPATGSLALLSNATLYLGLYYPHAQYLVVNGGVSLGGARLSLHYTPGAFPQPGVPYVLVSNDGDKNDDPVVGTFRNAAQGARVEGFEFYNLNPRGFLIDYAGGDGNDIALTRLAKAALTISAKNSSAVFGTTPELTAAFTPIEGTPLPVDAPVYFICDGQVVGSAVLQASGGGVAQAVLALPWKYTRVGPVSCRAEFPYTAVYDKAVSSTVTITFTGSRVLLPAAFRK